jgi:hypothetical protein
MGSFAIQPDPRSESLQNRGINNCDDKDVKRKRRLHFRPVPEAFPSGSHTTKVRQAAIKTVVTTVKKLKYPATSPTTEESSVIAFSKFK